MSEDLQLFNELLGDARYVVMPDLPASVYHSIDAFSSSGIPYLLQSPGHYMEWRRQERHATPAKDRGELFHMGVLEPKRFAEKIYLDDKPKPDGRTKQGKIDKAKIEEEHAVIRAAGNFIVNREEFTVALNMMDAVNACSSALRLLEDTDRELTILWRDAELGISCKARIDARRRSDGGLVDLKTTADASGESFGRSAAKYFYHSQGALYCIASEVAYDKSPPFYAWIPVESAPPYGVRPCIMEQDAWLKGRHLVDQAMKAYAYGRLKNWPTYPDEVQPLKFPQWALRSPA